MDSLFGTYELLYPMNWASDARLFRMPGSSLEDEMFVMAAMVTGKGWNSMSIQEVSAEQLAELLHHYHQALGPDSSCETNRTPRHGSMCHSRRKNGWWPRRAWHCWN